MKNNISPDLDELARMGRGGDTEIGHLTEGELVVPVAILARFPEARDALFGAFREAGIDPDRYIVGAAENSVNPETGVAEFFSPGTDPGSFGQGNDKFGGPGRTGGSFGQGNPRDTGQGNDPSDRNRSRSGGGGGRMTLPLEYADFILADGRRLEDVLGKSFFKRFGKKDKDKDGKGAAHARVLAERQAQARRLNQTRSILTGARGVAGAANTAKGRLSGG